MSELASRTFNAERGLALARETIGAYQKAFGDICNALGCEADDALALAAIAEQKGMIAALEADLERVQCELDEAEQALTAERQRREECEAALRRWHEYGDWEYHHKDQRENPSVEYFSRYPSDSDNRTKVAGSH